MQCFIIEGEKPLRDEFILSFKRAQNIKSYNLIEFDDVLLISQARLIKSTIAARLSKKEKRLILISIVPTIEAQNALLKTIEEIEDDTFLIFSLPTKNLLLETVTSRCFVRTFGNLKGIEQIQESLIDALVSAVLDKDSVKIALLIEKLISKNEKDLLAQLILGFREFLLSENENATHSVEKVKILVCVLKNLLIFHPLSNKNNLNVRLILENTLNVSRKLPIDNNLVI